MTPRALGVVVALAVLAGDQAAKLGVLARSETALDPTPIAPFLDLVLRWNRGISFSLFAQETAAGRVVLLALTLAAIVLLGWWLASSRSALSACGLGAIIGGAIGNGLDRLTRGAVVDFLDLHAFGRHFFVFNLADAAINVGVVLLILDLAFGPRVAERGREAAPPGTERHEGPVCKSANVAAPKITHRDNRGATFGAAPRTPLRAGERRGPHISAHFDFSLANSELHSTLWKETIPRRMRVPTSPSEWVWTACRKNPSGEGSGARVQGFQLRPVGSTPRNSRNFRG